MYLDILLVMIIIISIVICFKRGIVQSVFSVSSSLLTLLTLICFYKPFAYMFKSSDLGTSIYKNINDYMNTIITESSNNAISSSDLPEFIKTFLYTGTENLGDLTVLLTDKIMNLIIALTSFIVLLIIIKVIFKLLPAILNSITRLPIINQANRLLGGVAGIIIGLIWCIVTIYAIGLLSLHPSLDFLNEQISTSQILDLLHSAKISQFLF